MKSTDNTTRSELTNEALIDGELDLGDIAERPRGRADTFNRFYRAQSEARTKILGEIYSELDEPPYLLAMFFCRNYQPFFENWLRSCDERDIDPLGYTIAFTLDPESTDKAKALNVKTCYLDPKMEDGTGGAERFGDDRFRLTMLYKNAIIADCLNLDVPVLFQDSDMIWLRDPFPYLRGHEADYDIQIMYDGPNPKYKPLHGNTGFIYFRPGSANQMLLKTALRNSAHILASGGHQYPFIKILSYFVTRGQLKLHILPEAMFLNGHLFNLARGVSPKAQNWERDGIVLHYSWTGPRVDKFKKLEKFGMNYLSQGTAASKQRNEEDQDLSLDDNEVKLTIHLMGSDTIELICERTTPMLGVLLRAMADAQSRGRAHSVLRLETIEQGQLKETYLRPSHIIKLEITPPLRGDVTIPTGKSLIRRGLGRSKRAIRRAMKSWR